MTATVDRAPGALGALEQRWLSSRRQKTGTTLDLYCFAHAGGSGGEFVRWSDGLPGIKLWAVRMPGRAPRETEAPYTRLTDLVTDLVEQIDFGRRDFAFFGHSLGALVAFEVTRELRRAGRRLPRRLLLSSMQPPPITTRKSVHRLSDDQLLAEIEGRWGALPRPIHDDAEIRSIVLGHLRADAEIADTYAYVPQDPLPVPVTAFCGDQEDSAQLGWDVHTRAEFDSHVLPGGHFYFRDPDRQRELTSLISQSLSRSPGTEN
ncbi:alpha/beta fold hydrolase [Streptomyces sp. 150FB]|uniref:thioesterase II family protein n=1 Tax=Streptomyces sp. 150FB TaxID=1576605 RepID=UPI000695BD03|nr:alpha/beta fold hydrolase [Streptomyces sp. 150FB]